MSDYTSSHIRIPPEYSEWLASVEALAIRDLILHALPLQSVAEYSISQHGKDFPRPSEHFVIADYLIDLPIIAIDFGAASPTNGKVLGYAYGDFWLVGDSLLDFAERLKTDNSDAVWGNG